MQIEVAPTPREVVTPRHVSEAQNGPLAGELGVQAEGLYSEARLTSESYDGAKVLYEDAHASKGPGGIEGFKWTKDLIATTALRGLTKSAHQRALGRSVKHYRKNETAYRAQAVLDARADGVIINN